MASKFNSNLSSINGSTSEEVDIALILRQTNYSRGEALNRYVALNNDTSKVIREYMTGGADSTVVVDERTRTNNQEIFAQIRDMMDKAASNYELNKPKPVS